MEARPMSATAPVRKSFLKALNSSGAVVKQPLTESDQVLDFAVSVATGLDSRPRKLPCRFLYDARGSELFDAITRQPEYYLTLTEAGILASKAEVIREICGATTLVELGSGSSVKTKHLLRAWLAKEGSATYVPIDVSRSALHHASQSLAISHPGVRVIGIHSDYTAAFPLIRDISPVTVLFLGSTIGNFAANEMAGFVTSLARELSHDDYFLLGVDLVKDRETIEAAYNDAAGVTEEFTRNYFARMNRELRSDIDTAAIAHEAVYNEAQEQVEICARFSRRQVITIAPLGRSFVIEAGEAIQTEVSRKYRLSQVVDTFGNLGFATAEIFTDPRNWFALLLLRPSRSTTSPEEKVS